MSKIVHRYAYSRKQFILIIWCIISDNKFFQKVLSEKVINPFSRKRTDLSTSLILFLKFLQKIKLWFPIFLGIRKTCVTFKRNLLFVSIYKRTLATVRHKINKQYVFSFMLKFYKVMKFFYKKNLYPLLWHSVKGEVTFYDTE